MGTTLFYNELKSALSSAHTLQEVERIIQKEIQNISGFSIGFVVGKVTASDGDTRESNLTLLEKRTKEIGLIEQSNNILVFSSSVIPAFIEVSAQKDEFYIFWEQIVEKYADILYTTPNFEASKGASAEISLAQKMGKIITSYDKVIISKK